MQHRLILTGPAKDVFDRLKEICEANAKPELKVVFRTTIFTAETFVFKRVPVVGRVPS